MRRTPDQPVLRAPVGNTALPTADQIGGYRVPLVATYQPSAVTWANTSRRRRDMPEMTLGSPGPRRPAPGHIRGTSPRETPLNAENRRDLIRRSGHMQGSAAQLRNPPD